MTGLIFRGLTYYWRTNLAVIFGVATAVAVLAGALLVGDSVRGSLRDLVVGRLGKTDYVVLSSGFFREQLAVNLQKQPEAATSLSNVIPIVVANAVVRVQETGRKAGQVRVYGVDDRFCASTGSRVSTGRPVVTHMSVLPWPSSSRRAVTASSLCEWSGRRMFRSSRCTDAVTKWVERCD